MSRHGFGSVWRLYETSTVITLLGINRDKPEIAYGGVKNEPGVTEKKTNDRSEPSVNAVALIFDRLSPESRVRARDAALSYLGDSVKKSELVGVFLTDLSVVVLQPFIALDVLYDSGLGQVLR